MADLTRIRFTLWRLNNLVEGVPQVKQVVKPKADLCSNRSLLYQILESQRPLIRRVQRRRAFVSHLLLQGYNGSPAPL